MDQPNWANQTLWTGDCLDIMRGMNGESVDLNCLDLPFNPNTNYTAAIGSKVAGVAVKDTWSRDAITSHGTPLSRATIPRSITSWLRSNGA